MMQVGCMKICMELPPMAIRSLWASKVDRNDKPVAYWLTPPVGDWMIRDRQVIRVPAEEIIHAFWC